jgi:signal transduction histidine kinase
MTWPRTLTALHVRVPLLFLVLVAAVGSTYYFWMMHTVFATAPLDPEEELWYYELAAVEMDSLALLAVDADRARLEDLARDYGERIVVYEGEIVFFAPETGQVLAASDPDSLPRAIGSVDPQMLRDMATDDWSFATNYPDPSNIDAYVNRIFHVSVVRGEGGAPQAYLAGSYQPVLLTLEDITLDARRLWIQAVLVGLLGAFLVGWIVMAWLTRRIKSLSTAVSCLAAGHLSHRVHDKSPDDLGRLGQDFNTMAARLEQLVDKLRHKEQFQRQLIANISHDLRTPLANLRGNIEVLSLKQTRSQPSDYLRHLKVINASLDHMERLITHLLQLSRLEAGQAPIQGEDFRLPELVESVLDRCRSQAQENRIRLECHYPDDLPLVHGDPLQLGQVLQNLVDNGIKFGRQEGTVTIELAIDHDDDDAVSVVVLDDGPGIDPDHLPHIFERFYTGDHSRTHKGRSNGLGLAIAAKIVEGHGSKLTVSSEPDRGARFRFTLDRAASPKTGTRGA